MVFRFSSTIHLPDVASHHGRFAVHKIWVWCFYNAQLLQNKEQASMPFQADTREAEPSGFLCVSLPACLSLVFSLLLSLPASLSLFACLVQARTYTPNHNPDQPWARMATGQAAKPTNQPQTEAVLVWSSGAPER